MGEHIHSNHDLYTVEANLINKAVRALSNGEEMDPITKLRYLCFSRGASGLIGLGRTFRLMDTDGSETLNEEEFMTGIHDTGLDVTQKEMRQMFESFDENGSGSIDMTEFLVKLRPPISHTCLQIIDRAFSKMDKNGDGVIKLADVKRVYSARQHPKYLSGEATEDEILTEFITKFEDGRGNQDGTITKEEFINFYATIIASIENEMFFDLMMRRAWGL